MKRWQAVTLDPVFWVILSLALVLLPHFGRLPLWMATVIVILLGWRLAAIARPRLMPHKLVLLMVALGTGSGVVLHFGTLFGKTAGTAFLSVLLAIKLLESCSKRDYMLLIAMSFFIVVTNFFFTQSIPTAVMTLLLVVVLVMTMISINQDQAGLNTAERARLALKLVAQAFPLMLILFLLFPRIPGPLWKLPDDGQQARTGMSDTMSPGSISELIQSDAVAFRVQFESLPPAQRQLYWRGQVLWYFDGRTWEPGRHNPTTDPRLEILGQPVDYTITLEPHDRRWLFALDMPGQVPDDVRYNANFLLRSGQVIDSLHRYSLKSFLEYRIQPRISHWESSAGLKLPPASNPRTLALGQRWQARYSSPQQIIDRALQMFNEEDYRYTLLPPLTPGFDPADQFLFDTRAGFCEHYASAFTLLMRAAGIPARVVIGYQGGEMNPLNGVMTVRQSNAHAWSEVWLAGRGWVRVDPTASIAPQRIENSLDAALAADEYRPLHMRLNNGVLKALHQYWDAIDNRWNQWVIRYDQTAQQSMLSSLLDQDVDIYAIARLMIITFAVVFGIMAFNLLRPRRARHLQPCQRLYQRYCNKLARAGLPRAPHEGPDDYLHRAVRQFPQHADMIRLITAIYINARYRSRNRPAQMDRMKTLIRRLKLRRPPTN